MPIFSFTIHGTFGPTEGEVQVSGGFHTDKQLDVVTVSGAVSQGDMSLGSFRAEREEGNFVYDYQGVRDPSKMEAIATAIEGAIDDILEKMADIRAKLADNSAPSPEE